MKSNPEIEIQDDPDEAAKLIVIPVAEDKSSGFVVSVVSQLALTIMEDEDVSEFSFWIAIHCADGTAESFDTQDRDVAFRYIPPEVRPLVMELVRTSMAELVADGIPRLIYRVTKEAGLPEKALTKHHLLTETLENIGYFVKKQGTDFCNRHYWLMEREGY
jgi:hypothetical protein